MTAGLGRVFPLLLGLAIALATPAVQAAPAAVKKIEALNAKAISAYEAGDSKKAEGLLQEAVVLAKQKGLATHTAVARTYLTMGLILIDGLAEEEKGERYFALALRIDPTIKMKANANEAVATAFDRAQGQAAKDREKEAALAKEAEGTETADATETTEATEAAGSESEAPARGPTAAEQRAEARKLKLMQLAYEKETRDQEAADRAEQNKIRAELTESQDAARKEREAKAKLYTERTLLASEKDGLQAELKGLKADKTKLEADKTKLEADKAKLQAERDKLQAEAAKLLKDKQDLEKQLAEARGREKQQQAELSNLQKKQQSDLTALQKQQQAEKERLAKDKAALDKQLADAAQREKSEREAKLKLEEEKKQVLAKQAEDKQKEKERLEKEKLVKAKLAEAPDMPSSLPQKVYCLTADSHPRGADVHVHCATQPQVKAEQLTLYYRPSGHANYSSAGMERSKGGWRSAMIPAALVKGTMLQYYVEAHTGRRVVATNGKPALPNVTMVNQFPTVASETPGLVPAGGAKARSRGKRSRPQ
jgi:hypothetical protein